MRSFYALLVGAVLLLTGCASSNHATNTPATVILTSDVDAASLHAYSHEILAAHRYQINRAQDAASLLVTNAADSEAPVVLQMTWRIEPSPWGTERSMLTASGTCRRNESTPSPGVSTDAAEPGQWMPDVWFAGESCFVHMMDLLSQLPHVHLWYEQGSARSVQAIASRTTYGTH